MEVASGRRPKRSASAAHAAGVPGTVTANGPYLGTSVWPSAVTLSSVMPMGAGPLAFKPCI